jgi:hypothetical protein
MCHKRRRLCPDWEEEEVSCEDHRLRAGANVGVGVREPLGHGGRGEGDNQSDGDDELL